MSKRVASKQYRVKVDFENYRAWVNGKRLSKIPSNESGVRYSFTGRGIVLKASIGWADQNRMEYEKWNAARARDRKYLAPVLAVAEDDAWVIVKKLRLKKSWRAMTRRRFRTVERVAKRLDIGDLGRYHNWAVVGDQAVIYDYGCDSYSSIKTKYLKRIESEERRYQRKRQYSDSEAA